MEGMRSFSKYLKYFLWVIVVVQFIALIYKEASVLTFWIFIEYAQLISYLPLMKSRYVPWLYEVYQPFLGSHLIFV